MVWILLILILAAIGAASRNNDELKKHNKFLDGQWKLKQIDNGINKSKVLEFCNKEDSMTIHVTSSQNVELIIPNDALALFIDSIIFRRQGQTQSINGIKCYKVVDGNNIKIISSNLLKKLLASDHVVMEIRTRKQLGLGMHNELKIYRIPCAQITKEKLEATIYKI